jgi:hypothetical protein
MIIKSLHEWGVNETHRQYNEFRAKVIRETMRNIGEKKPACLDHLKVNDFQEDPIEAIKHVVRSDFDGESEEM